MGKIYVIGIGPGGAQETTPRAQAALAASDVLVGYTTYIDLVKEHYPGKDTIATPMTTEVARCRTCRDLALKGRTVAMICSGDAGVYGMAGLIHQVCEDAPKLEIEVIPGVTAATAGAALLGAPLVHDFAVISLSDALTSWGTIAKRLELAAEGDFVLCLYNPANKTRPDTLKKAADILLLARSEMASFVDSLVAPLSVINALIVAVGLKKKKEISRTYATLESIWEEYQVYEKTEGPA